MKITIADTRQFITNIYMWLTTNDDLDFVEKSVIDCSSEEYRRLRCKLHVLSQDSRKSLNELAEHVDNTDDCINRLRLCVERERQIRKEEKANKKLKKKNV